MQQTHRHARQHQHICRYPCPRDSQRYPFTLLLRPEHGLVTRLVGLHAKEKRVRTSVPIRRQCDLGNRARCIHRRRIGAALRPVLLPCWIRAVEVAFQVFNREDRVLGRWSGTPSRIAIAPVRQRDVARRCGNSTGHGIKQDTVGVELDGIGGPVETILVEAF